MKFIRSRALLGILGGILLGASWAAGEEKVSTVIPVEDFARTPDLTEAKISPDGKFMGYLFTHEGRTEVGFLNLGTGKAQYFNPGRSLVGSNLQMAGFEWVSNERVIVATTVWGHWIAGLAAVNRGADGWFGLTGAPRWDSIRHGGDFLNANELIYTSAQDAENVLLLDRSGMEGKLLYPDVIAMDTTTGGYQTRVKNPGNIIQWLPNWEGEVRFGMSWENKRSHLNYRESTTAPWQVISDLGKDGTESSFVGLDPTGQIVHLAYVGEKGHWALYPFDLQKKQLGEAIFAHNEYDILQPEYRPEFAGASLSAAVYSRKSRALLGVRYVTEGPKQFWFDPIMATIQKQIDALHPELTNLVVSMDQADNRMLVLSWSDREPGIYSLVDLAAQKVSVIGRRMPWIKPEQLSVTYPIKCEARDGLPLHGYLTLPTGAGKKNLPLVMLVHGGPWVRDVWGFDPLVQFLANRGYGVLQINYRGSTGYGAVFSAKGNKEVGGAIQDDITDAVHWAVRQGIADPKRIAIMGASYGGYSTLFALAKTPELYRCGIDLAGVTDWSDLLAEHNKDSTFAIAYAYWEKRMGGLTDGKVRQRLAEVSPMNFAEQIKAPLLIVHGKEDMIVPLTQTKRLVTLMEKQGHEPETLYLSDLGHSYPRDKQGEEFLNKLEAFLKANLGP